MTEKIGGLAYRLEGVLNAAETVLRAEAKDNDFVADAAQRRLVEALDAYAEERFPQLRGKRGGIRKVVVCVECGELRQHAAKGRCDNCRMRLLRRTRYARRAA